MIDKNGAIISSSTLLTIAVFLIYRAWKFIWRTRRRDRRMRNIQPFGLQRRPSWEPYQRCVERIILITASGHNSLSPPDLTAVPAISPPPACHVSPHLRRHRRRVPCGQPPPNHRLLGPRPLPPPSFTASFLAPSNFSSRSMAELVQETHSLEFPPPPPYNNIYEPRHCLLSNI
jgi:hypothetical protein